MFKLPKNIGLRILAIAGMVIGGLAIGTLIALAFGFLVMILWNWLMPSLFGLKAITYWQGFGIVLLAHLIFGHIGGHRPGHPKSWKHHKPHWGDCEGQDDWKIEGGWKNWKHYRDYWKEEGREAFENYLKKKKENPENKPE